MPNNEMAETEDTKRSEDLISMKNLSLLVLPWLGLQKTMIQSVKKANTELPHEPVLKALMGSQVGLMMIMKQRRLGQALVERVAPNPEDASKKMQKIGKRAEAFARRSNEFLESYEVVLDATIEELKRKRTESK